MVLYIATDSVTIVLSSTRSTHFSAARWGTVRHAGNGKQRIALRDRSLLYTSNNEILHQIWSEQIWANRQMHFRNRYIFYILSLIVQFSAVSPTELSNALWSNLTKHGWYDAEYEFNCAVQLLKSGSFLMRQLKRFVKCNIRAANPD